MRELDRLMLETKQHFGFKKVSKGVASALLGLSLAYGIGTVTASTVEASELEPGVGVNGEVEMTPVVDEGASETVSPVVVDSSDTLSDVVSEEINDQSNVIEDVSINEGMDSSANGDVTSVEPTVDAETNEGSTGDQTLGGKFQTNFVGEVEYLSDSNETSSVNKEVSHSNFQSDEGIKAEDFDFSLTPSSESEQEAHYEYNGNEWRGTLSFNYKGDRPLNQVEWRVPKVNRVGDSDVEFEFLSTGSLSASTTSTGTTFRLSNVSSGYQVTLPVRIKSSKGSRGIVTERQDVNVPIQSKLYIGKEHKLTVDNVLTLKGKKEDDIDGQYSGLSISNPQGDLLKISREALSNTNVDLPDVLLGIKRENGEVSHSYDWNFNFTLNRKSPLSAKGDTALPIRDLELTVPEGYDLKFATDITNKDIHARLNYVDTTIERTSSTTYLVKNVLFKPSEVSDYDLSGKRYSGVSRLVSAPTFRLVYIGNSLIERDVDVMVRVKGSDIGSSREYNSVGYVGSSSDGVLVENKVFIDKSTYTGNGVYLEGNREYFERVDDSVSPNYRVTSLKNKVLTTQTRIKMNDPRFYLKKVSLSNSA